MHHINQDLVSVAIADLCLNPAKTIAYVVDAGVRSLIISMHGWILTCLIATNQCWPSRANACLHITHISSLIPVRGPLPCMCPSSTTPFVIPLQRELLGAVCWSSVEFSQQAVLGRALTAPCSGRVVSSNMAYMFLQTRQYGRHV
jgi:hypothetical protein